jgi:hypothetical protein
MNADEHRFCRPSSSCIRRCPAPKEQPMEGRRKTPLRRRGHEGQTNDRHRWNVGQPGIPNVESNSGKKEKARANAAAKPPGIPMERHVSRMEKRLDQINIYEKPGGIGRFRHRHAGRPTRNPASAIGWTRTSDSTQRAPPPAGSLRISAGDEATLWYVLL